jgi:hypothetical protein
MKVYYFNDQRKEITVKIHDSSFDPDEDNSKHYHRLKSCEGRLFDLAIPVDSAIYIKSWPDMVMISYIETSALLQSVEQLHDQDEG